MTVDAANSGCYGTADGQITLSVMGGTAPYTISWSTSESQTMSEEGSITIPSLPDGTYDLTVTDDNGCSAEVTGIVIAQLTTQLTITANTTSWIYDGQAHTDPGYTVKVGDGTPIAVTDPTAGFTIPGTNDVLKAVVEGTVTNVSSTAQTNAVSSYTITRNGVDVKCQYAAATTVDGALSITPLAVSVNITGNTATMEYTG